MSNINKLIIYEGAMCCSSGVCGPRPDQNMIEFQDNLNNIIKTGVIVERYSITQDSRKFMEDTQIIKLIQEQQLKALPILVFNGRVIKIGSYPSKDELQVLLNTGISEGQSIEQRKTVESQ